MTFATGYSLPPGGFAWALECLKAGQKVRQKGWNPVRLIQWDGRGLLDEEGEHFVVRAHMLFAEDWELAP